MCQGRRGSGRRDEGRRASRPGAEFREGRVGNRARTPRGRGRSGPVTSSAPIRDHCRRPTPGSAPDRARGPPEGCVMARPFSGIHRGGSPASAEDPPPSMGFSRGLEQPRDHEDRPGRGRGRPGGSGRTGGRRVRGLGRTGAKPDGFPGGAPASPHEHSRAFHPRISLSASRGSPHRSWRSPRPRPSLERPPSVLRTAGRPMTGRRPPPPTTLKEANAYKGRRINKLFEDKNYYGQYRARSTAATAFPCPRAMRNRTQFPQKGRSRASPTGSSTTAR